MPEDHLLFISSCVEVVVQGMQAHQQQFMIFLIGAKSQKNGQRSCGTFVQYQ